MDKADDIHRPMSVNNAITSSALNSSSSEKSEVNMGVPSIRPHSVIPSEGSSSTDLPSRSFSPLPTLSSRDANGEDFSDESDDELQDWSLLNNISKKGMKDLEPLLNDSDKSQMSSYDQSRLNKARNLRFHALASKRGAIVNLENVKASTIFVNVNDYDDLFMTQPKGKFLETMGFIDNQNICHFGFEEVLYLVERGSCMLKFWDKSNPAKNDIYEKMPPLSLQSAYSILIKNEEQLNQYMVYSILKRDGYIINRHEEFSGQVSEKKVDLFKSEQELFKNIQMSWWTKVLARVSEIFQIDFPYKFAFSYFNIFTYLRSQIKPQSLPKLKNVNVVRPKSKNYKISFNVWKPSPNFKKKNPPLPDYQLTIFKATDTLPKYSEIRSLLERANSNPETWKPKPKSKNRQPTSSAGKTVDNIKTEKSSVLESSWDYSKGIDLNKLKNSENRITLAILDNSTINFITLSHACFVQEGPVWRDHWVTWRPPLKKNTSRRGKNNQRKVNNTESAHNARIEKDNDPSILDSGKTNSPESNGSVAPVGSSLVLPKTASF